MHDLGNTIAAAVQPRRMTAIDTTTAVQLPKRRPAKPHTHAAAAAAPGQCVQSAMPLRLSNRRQLAQQPQKPLHPQPFDCSGRPGRSSVPLATAVPAAASHQQPGSAQQADACGHVQQTQEGPASASSSAADTAPHLEERQAAFLLFQERRRRRAEGAAVIQAHVRCVYKSRVAGFQQPVVFCYAHHSCIQIPACLCCCRGLLARREARWRKAAAELQRRRVRSLLRRWRATAAARLLLRERAAQLVTAVPAMPCFNAKQIVAEHGPGGLAAAHCRLRRAATAWSAWVRAVAL